MSIIDKLRGILVPAQLWKFHHKDMNGFHYDKIMSKYVELIEGCNYYSNQYYMNPSAENEKLFLDVQRKCNEYEAHFNWVKTEYDRYL